MEKYRKHYKNVELNFNPAAKVVVEVQKIRISFSTGPIN